MKYFLFVSRQKMIPLIVGLALISNMLYAQEETPKNKELNNWSFTLTPYALLAAQSTDVGGEKLRQSFNDLSSITNAGFQIVGTIRYKRLYLSFDGTFARLGEKTNQGPLAINLQINQNIFDLNTTYNIYENLNFTTNEVLNGWTFGLTIGAKYWKNDIGVDYSLVINDITLLEDSFTENQEWWDLMTGIRLNFILSKRVLLGVSGKVGGFGLGNSSKFAYDFTYINSFKVHRNISIDAGFRSFRYKRIDGEGTEELTTVVNVLGPLLGVSITI